MRVSLRGIFLFVAGTFILVAPRWLPDEPLWKRAAIFLLGLALLVFATWQSKKPSGSAAQGNGIIRGYWVARAGIPGIGFLLAPFDMTDAPPWKRAGLFLLGVAFLALAAWQGSTQKSQSETGS
jgi:hypothetical protein